MLQTALITDASAPVQAFVGWVNELIEKYNEGYRPSDSEINIHQKQGYADFQLAAMLHIPMNPVRDYRQLVDMALLTRAGLTIRLIDQSTSRERKEAAERAASEKAAREPPGLCSMQTVLNGCVMREPEPRHVASRWFGCTKVNVYMGLPVLYFQIEHPHPELTPQSVNIMAFRNGLQSAVSSGACTVFEEGEPVFEVGAHGLLAQIKREGETKSYWTRGETIGGIFGRS